MGTKPHKNPNKLPYYNTKVSIRDTVSNVKELLKKYNLVGIQITEYGVNFRLIFALERYNKKHTFKFELIVPEDAKFARQKFRAFYWHLKSRLEAVDFGLFTLEEIFMPELMVQMPSGDINTVKEILASKQMLLPLGREYFDG